MKFALIGLVAAVSSAVAAPIAVSAQPVVVELYTSQGCSSCPPADDLLGKLATRPDVIPLALHVDYWDYIGWKDTFARPSFTQRQRGYAKAAGHRTVYTPQMVIAGQDHVVGNEPMAVVDLIEEHRDQPVQAQVVLERKGDEVSVSLRPVAGLTGPLVVQLVRYAPQQRVEIGRGENAGKTIDYANVVTEWTPLADWDGSGPLDLTAPAAGPDGVAVLVQRKNYGPILAAAAIPPGQ